MKKHENHPGLQQHLHQCRHLCRSIHHTGAGGQGQCRHQKAGETCLKGGPSWVKSMRFGEDNKYHPIKNFWVLVEVTLKISTCSITSTLNAANSLPGPSVFWPREIVAKGHSHPWAIPWFCTPMVYPPQALRGHRSRSGLLKRQWTGGLMPRMLSYPHYCLIHRRKHSTQPQWMVVDSNDQPFMGSNSYPWPDHSPDRRRFYTLLAPDHCPRLPQSPVAGWHSKQL